MATKETLIDPKVLEFLVCPISKTTLVLDSERKELISQKAKLAFPIKNGIPLMLIDEARKLDSTD